MSMHSFFSQLFHTSTLRRAAITLTVLAWSSLTFGGEIHKAVRNVQMEKVKALLKADPSLVSSKDKDMDGRTPLHVAAAEGYKDMAELLLANKAEVNAKTGFGNTPLHFAAERGYNDVVELLLSNKAEVDAKDGIEWTPFLYAAARGHKDTAKLLLAKGNKGIKAR